MLGCPPTCYSIYWFLETCWVLLYAVSSIMIEAKTEVVDGFIHQVAIQFNALHFGMMAVVLYASESRARPAIILGFLAVIITDVAITLHDALHLSFTPQPYYWAFGLNMAVSSFGLFISCYALIWYIRHLFYHWSGQNELIKYQAYR